MIHVELAQKVKKMTIKFVQTVNLVVTKNAKITNLSKKTV